MGRETKYPYLSLFPPQDFFPSNPVSESPESPVYQETVARYRKRWQQLMSIGEFYGLSLTKVKEFTVLNICSGYPASIEALLKVLPEATTVLNIDKDPDAIQCNRDYDKTGSTPQFQMKVEDFYRQTLNQEAQQYLVLGMNIPGMAGVETVEALRTNTRIKGALLLTEQPTEFSEPGWYQQLQDKEVIRASLAYYANEMRYTEVTVDSNRYAVTTAFCIWRK